MGQLLLSSLDVIQKNHFAASLDCNLYGFKRLLHAAHILLSLSLSASVVYCVCPLNKDPILTLLTLSKAQDVLHAAAPNQKGTPAPLNKILSNIEEDPKT